jgi:predicted nucleotidyltransferase
MLERLFTSATRTKLLSTLIFHQDREFHLREIARLIGSAPINAAKELENLARLNLVLERKKGNLKLYVINRKSPILPALRDLFLRTDYLGDILKRALEGKAMFAFIYGSFARGEESQSSDIDLFIIGRMDEDELLRIISRLETRIGREINYVLWTEKTFRERRSHPLLRKIKTEKIIMITGDEDEFRKAIR